MVTLDSVRKAKVLAALSNDNLDFGALLRTIRTVLGIKMLTACEDTGIGSQKMRMLEKSRFRREPNPHDIKTLANYYGIPYDYLQYKLDEQMIALKNVFQRKKDELMSEND